MKKKNPRHKPDSIVLPSNLRKDKNDLPSISFLDLVQGS